MYFHPYQQQGYFVPNQEMPMHDPRQVQFPGGFPGGGTGQVDRRLDRLERQVQRIDQRVDRLERRVNRIERQLGIRDDI